MNPRDKAVMRKNILAHLQAFVYGPFDDFYKRELTEICEANDALLGGRTYRFRFEGVIYDQPGVTVAGPRGKVHALYKEHESRLRAVLEEKQVIDRTERPFVMNYLQKLLLRFDNTRDILIHLPAVLRRPFAEFISVNGLQVVDMDIDTAGEAVGACEKSLALLKQRLMLNLLLGDR